MNKRAVLVGLGDYYSKALTGYSGLPFVSNNLVLLGNKLKSDGWQVYMPLTDSAASKANIIRLLQTAVDDCAHGDWLLFYFTGHGAKYALSTGAYEMYCVTYTPTLRYDFTPAFHSFFSERDYENIVKFFAAKTGNGHMITILDCCYAFGLVDEMMFEKNYHTVIAGSSQDVPAYYDDNSVFFSALMESWNSPFGEMLTALENAVAEMQAPSECVVQVAIGFKNASLNQKTI